MTTINNALNTATVPVPVTEGGTGLATATTAYTVICSGTTATGNLQPLSSVGSAGQVLTSNGAGALPSWSAGGGGGGGGNLIGQVVFTTSGTWTKPAGCNTVIVEVMGAGGGGAGPGGAGAYGGGGAAGAYARKLINVTLISSETITIGSGGAGGTAANGSAGGTTSFGALVSCTGGGGGGQSTTLTSGGVATGGDININGQHSTYPYQFSSSTPPPGPTNKGSDCIFGFGQAANVGGANGTNGTGYGSGGSGSTNSFSTFSGAAGQPGIVIVYEYS